MDILYKGFSCTILNSYTSASFSDALNTVDPPISGARGFTPSYSIWDFTATLKTASFFSVRAGLNNIFNRQYFTKRPTVYSGPGIDKASEQLAFFIIITVPYVLYKEQIATLKVIQVKEPVPIFRFRLMKDFFTCLTEERQTISLFFQLMQVRGN